MPPETGWHCVYNGSAEDYIETDNISVTDGTCDEVLDPDKEYYMHDGVRYDDLAEVPCEWDD